ncbi:ATP-binding cassette domain-containing protein [Granulosicoccus sp. 3-233]|uniref:ATP-binding cassette domain-containing protein n=1 Tax=Granulosicoccus sp. 3-233 TaxID=3417969 RepID=UPI003D334C09
MRSSIILNDLFWLAPDGYQPFVPLSLQLGPNRTGLVGRNGAGKSTLLELIGGRLQPAGGHIHRDGRVAILRQDLHGVETISDLFGATEALAVLARAAAGTASLDELAEADWELPVRMEQCLQRFSLDVAVDQSLSSLSGGQGTRARLAALLFQRPDFILLDEPTNHLDREGRDQVLSLLHGWRGGALVASHDREVLDAMDAVVELGAFGAKRYGGNGTFHREAKAAELSQAEQALTVASRQSAELAAHRQQVAERQSRRDKSGRRRRHEGGQPRILLNAMAGRSEETSANQSRITKKRQESAAEQLQAARSRVEMIKPLSVSLPSTGLARGQCVVQLEQLTGGYPGGSAVIEGLDLQLVGPERIAVQGGNGTGKSTLLTLISGHLAPWSGTIQVIPDNVLLDQQLAILDRTTNVLDNFQQLNPGADATESRTLLSRLQFRDESVLQPLHGLSGGQLMRVALGCTIGNDRPARLLMLDEPTNHLDLAAQEALEAALQHYDGALLVVSHDERFLDAIGIDRQLTLT